MDRRQFCLGTFSALLLGDLITSSTLGLLNEANAALNSASLRNYICFWMIGGAERAWFDGILTPNGSTDMLGQGPGIFTGLENGKDLIYKTTQKKVNEKFFLPHLWDSILPTAGAASVAMNSLASNMAIIRGLHTGLSFDAHGPNVSKAQTPFPNLNILGAVADSTNETFLPAIKTTGSFSSNSNKSAYSLGKSANAYEVFKPLKLQEGENNPFDNAASAELGVKDLDKVVTSFINSLSNQMPKRKAKTIEVMMDNRKKAVELISKGFEGIENDYKQAYALYQTVINLVMNPTSDRLLEGLDDRPVYGSGETVQFWSDTPGSYKDFSIVEGLKQANCNTMAHAFAKAEVFLKYKVTNCLMLDIGNIKNVGQKHSRADNGHDIGHDSHYTGDVLRCLALSRFYQSFAACMLHFRQQTSSMPGQSAGSVWAETLVNLRSEFNRGGFKGRGADHNINSCVESFFSGAIQSGPIVTGNIEYSSSDRCVGNGAPVDKTKGVMDSKYVYSTIGELMGYTPSRNHAPVLKIQNGKIVSNIGGPANIKKAS